jgi:hypothetical protein
LGRFAAGLKAGYRRTIGIEAPDGAAFRFFGEACMKPLRPTVFVAISLAALLAVLPIAQAQQPPASATAPKAAPAAGGKTFSQQDLDELLAPIALYPDALLAQVLMASTYPLEVVEAARFVKANPSLKDKALEEALKDKSWDASVKSLTLVPQVLPMMNEKLDWTQKLGDAVLAQQEDVMITAQNLRKKAQQAGNLKSTPEVNVKEEQQNNKTVVIIESAKPETVYVPTYNPATAYGTWWYAYPPPYYYYPPGYVAGAAFWSFTAGAIIGGALWGGCGWGNNDINIDIDRQNNFNRNTSRNTDRTTNRGSNKFQHNAEHRKGVNYRDNATAQKFNRGSDRAAAQSREQFRGHANTSRQQLQGMDRASLQNQVSAADRQSRGGDMGSRGGDRGGASASQRGGGDFGSRGGGASASQRSASASQRGGGGFSGASGSGASARQASSRGSSSMGSRGGGGGGRGGGGRR